MTNSHAARQLKTGYVLILFSELIGHAEAELNAVAPAGFVV